MQVVIDSSVFFAVEFHLPLITLDKEIQVRAASHVEIIPVSSF